MEYSYGIVPIYKNDKWECKFLLINQKSQKHSFRWFPKWHKEKSEIDFSYNLAQDSPKAMALDMVRCLELQPDSYDIIYEAFEKIGTYWNTLKWIEYFKEKNSTNLS